MEQLLNDIEKSKLGVLMDDDILLETLKKVFLFNLYHAGRIEKDVKVEPGRNFVFDIPEWGKISNEKLGENVRAIMEAIVLLEGVFKELEMFKKVEKKDNISSNEAR